tara:strand:- start:109 stop:246 length:138 start_codon:yes stop_codon:yes gene_type:complete
VLYFWIFGVAPRDIPMANVSRLGKCQHYTLESSRRYAKVSANENT